MAEDEKIKVPKEELKKRLTPIQYTVTQEAGTERPFTGELVAKFFDATIKIH